MDKIGKQLSNLDKFQQHLVLTLHKTIMKKSNKMRSISFLILFFLNSISSTFSQEIIQKVDWKEGESKQITIQLNSKEIKNGKTTMDTTLISRSEIFVREITDSCYLIKFKTENQLVNLGLTYYHGLMNELSNNRNLEIDIKINKDSMVSEIMNKGEYDTNLNKTRDQIIEILKIRAPEKVDLAAIQLDKLLISLKQKSEALQTIDFILDSYKIKYSFADTLITTDSKANPFKLQNFNGAKVKTYIQKMKGSNTFNIVVKRDYDFDAYKDLMLGLSNQVMGTVGKMVSDNGDSNAGSQIDGMFNTLLNLFKFEASEYLIITRQVDSNWPIKLLKKIDLKAIAANQKSTVLIDLLIEIK